MHRMKTCTAIVGVCVTSIATFGLLTPASANPVSVKPPVVGAPGGRVPGGTRDPGCLGNQSLMALVPLSTVGSTAAQYPTFLLSVPSAAPKSAIFTLQDESRKLVYKTTVNLSGKAGITSFQLPKSMAGLKIGKNYRWVFSLVCNAQAPDQSGNPFVQGWIKRVEMPPTLAQQLQQTSRRDRVTLYQNAGLWYDALATLAELRRTDPNDRALKTAWTNLLNSAGLNQVVTNPLL
ncbi:DUF928 domain-containing protein [Leptolyngbya sp. FACHB-36]|uniref:DUF928 domain-containing protein n=1 Tax=Leptolyngbya sp. FACHB-36 TaxID=2692808 RepID=UPI00168022CE|nr:DUF928 domain-containing protein [Leptolyngbya sp. FACHB-36]MBD2021921.1 DUF928 domain-containing protein [Leptolyngbya sp. FACHB-36]